MTKDITDPDTSDASETEQSGSVMGEAKEDAPPLAEEFDPHAEISVLELIASEIREGAVSERQLDILREKLSREDTEHIDRIEDIFNQIDALESRLDSLEQVVEQSSPGVPTRGTRDTERTDSTPFDERSLSVDEHNTLVEQMEVLALSINRLKNHIDQLSEQLEFDLEEPSTVDVEDRSRARPEADDSSISRNSSRKQGDEPSSENAVNVDWKWISTTNTET